MTPEQTHLYYRMLEDSWFPEKYRCYTREQKEFYRYARYVLETYSEIEREAQKNKKIMEEFKETLDTYSRLRDKMWNEIQEG